MQIKYLLSVLAVTSVTSASPVKLSKKSQSSFGLLAINSGTDLHYQPIKATGDSVAGFNVGGSGSDVKFTLDSNTLTVGDEKVVVNPTNGEVGDLASSDSPSVNFSVENGHLLHDGSPSFYGCPNSDNTYQLYTESCKKGIEIALKTV